MPVTRRTDHHQTFAPDGTLLSETVEEEPIEQYNERTVTDRLQTSLTTISAAMTRLQKANMKALSSDADRLEELRGDLRDLHALVRTVVRATLKAYDTLDAE